ncbi:uncharacterized protein LOC133525352 [Cydia pomonella]|uniref:uncharacterized protein LOC133525352 n=1 Tax=Cydia pomonella TaxID=82600 RepID=UPI002ADD7B97|nr:uncharacterized protein LOC133525352 [Cydia pomonella]
MPISTENNVVPVINGETPLVTENNENNAVPPPGQDTTNEITIYEVLATILHKFEQIQEDIKTLSGEFKIITENQQALFQNQNNMLLKFAESQTQFEEFVHKSYASTENTKKHDVKPISNKKDLQELELLLADPDFKAKFRNTLEVGCSKGKKRGTTNAYAVIDILFQRSFLCECSWTGGSRTEGSKTCLKSFTNIFDLFFSVLHESDPDFILLIDLLIVSVCD